MMGNTFVVLEPHKKFFLVNVGHSYYLYKDPIDFDKKFRNRLHQHLHKNLHHHLGNMRYQKEQQYKAHTYLDK
jgi:hypothetical protein